MSHHAQYGSERSLRRAGIFNTVTSTAQFIVGIMTGSVAIRSDGLHNMTDGISILFSWVGARTSRKPPDKKRTYGYHRVGIITATLNALTLLVLAAVISVFAYLRLINPTPVSAWALIVTGCISLVINFGTFAYVHKDAGEDVNVLSAALHAFLDGVSSVLTVVAGLIILAFKWYQADAVFSFGIAALMIWGAYHEVLKKTINELLEGTPPGIDTDTMTAHIQNELGHVNIHDLHVWKIGAEFTVVSLHMVFEDPQTTLIDVDRRRAELEACLTEHFKINHITVQTEAENCQR